MSAEASPDSRCPICLDTFNNIAYVDLCMHKFCFLCILEWSKSKAQCPLCNQQTYSIYHSIKSEQDYKKINLTNTAVTGVHGLMRGQDSSGPSNGIVFEISTSIPQQRQAGYIRSMMVRLAANREAASEGKAVNNVTEQEMVNFRMEVYRRGVRVLYVCDGSLFQDISAEHYKAFPARLCKLMPWLKRELMVLCGSYLWDQIQYAIISHITTHDMESEAIVDVLRPYLLTYTEHFLHEFISFAKSPFTMEVYDHHAVYDCPDPYSSTAEQSRTEHPSVLDSDVIQGEGPPGESVSSDSDDDCVIVGFVKPAAERTPELVLLSSAIECVRQEAPPSSLHIQKRPQRLRNASRQRHRSKDREQRSRRKSREHWPCNRSLIPHSNYSAEHSHSYSWSRSRESYRRERSRSRSRSCSRSKSRSPSVRRKSHHIKPGVRRKYKTSQMEEFSLHEESDSPVTKRRRKAPTIDSDSDSLPIMV